MTDNHNHLPYGGSERRDQNRRKWDNIVREVGGFGVAEIVAEGAWLGVAAVTAMLPDKLMNKASKVVGHTIIEPVLTPLEAVMDKLCRLEECKIDKTQSREKRSENLARALIIFTPALAASWGAKIWIRHACNKKLGVGGEHRDSVWSPEAKMIFGADELTQVGAMYVLNNQLAPVSDDMIRTTTRITQKMFGVSERKAHDFATAAVVWAVPNSIGALGATVAIMGKHLYGWPKGWIGKVLGKNPGDQHIS